MRLSDFYATMRKEAEDAAPEAVDAVDPVDVDDIDKVAYVAAIVSEMEDGEREALAEALGAEPTVEKDATEDEVVEPEDEVVKQAEDIFTAGRIFAKGLMAEVGVGE